jgi:(2Fe-2S) ferredoxin
MVKPVRVRTAWFKKEGERPSHEIASVVAATIWRLADKAVENLSKADYDIVTPQRGFRIIGELACFLVHYSDRLVYGRVDEEKRTEIVTAVGVRVAEIMEDNILDFTEGRKDPEYDYKQGFIDLLNTRMKDYSEFEFPIDKASFQALRFLSLQIRDCMEDSDKSWIQDQIMDIEVPEMMGTVKKSIDGFYPALVTGQAD